MVDWELETNYLPTLLVFDFKRKIYTFRDSTKNPTTTHLNVGTFSDTI